MTQFESEHWRRGVYERIASAVRDARGSRSAQDIADATAVLGCPITRSQISNFETGRRQSFDVTELLILAAALGVPPAVLIYPDLPAGHVETLPGVTMLSIEAYHWFTGEAPSPIPAPPGSRGRQLVQSVRERSKLHVEGGRLTISLGLGVDSLGEPLSETEREFLSQRQRTVKAKIAELDSRITELGGVLDA